MRKYGSISTGIILSCFVILMSPLQAATPMSPLVVKNKLEVFGVGADVRIKLATGEQLAGSIGAIDADRFDLITDHDAAPRPLTYDQVAEVKFARSTYKTSGSPDPAEVRRVVAGLGVGRHVAAKLSGKTFRGHLHAIEQEHFVVVLDKVGQPMEIAYGDVQSLGPNLSKGAKIALGIAASAAAIGISIAVFGSHAGEGPQPTF